MYHFKSQKRTFRLFKHEIFSVFSFLGDNLACLDPDPLPNLDPMDLKVRKNCIFFDLKDRYGSELCFSP
jgi:hypothetical protein